MQITLEIPAPLAERLAQASCDSDRSIARVILDALWKSSLLGPDLERMSPQEQLNWALRDVARPLTEEESNQLGDLFGDESDLPEMTSEELRAFMPKLPPENGSPPR